MLSRKTSTLLLLASLSMIVTAVIVARPRKNQDAPPSKEQSAEPESETPIIDIGSQNISDIDNRAKRQAKSKKYNNAQIPISDSSGEIVSMIDWEVGLSSLPVDRSQAVVVGTVTQAQAFLSDDKSAVYSEFTIQVENVFKNNSHVALTPGGSMVVERDGGRVRFPSGNIVIQQTRGQRMPRVGRRYVIFATHDFPLQGTQEDLYLLTAYELRNGRVFTLDRPGGGKHPIAAKYKDASETSLLNDLRMATSN